MVFGLLPNAIAKRTVLLSRQFFNTLQGVFNNIWVEAETQRRFRLGRLGRFLWSRLGRILWGKTAAFVVFVIAGLIFWVSFILHHLVAAFMELDMVILGVKLSRLRMLWLTLGFIVPIFISMSMIFLVYIFVPRVRVSVKAAISGAAFAAVFLQISRFAFSFMIVKFNLYGKVYGPATSFVIFMMWLYLAMNMILLGAELGAQCQEVLFRPDKDTMLSSGTTEK